MSRARTQEISTCKKPSVGVFMETVLQIQWIKVTLETYAAYSNKLMKFFAVSRMRRDTVLNTEYPIGAKEHMVQ